ncbi:serine hydrolase domain-containing protein [Flavivirga abyssicola]|uniref:serine hydrolase domain-containing protein n=1 Tax=Flavivirga abyssicola TaxID=3063533 RepID=UPI0026E017B4|nr:serine hydrolase domain-containing protein [Flavivirga sp. MEBiC07777]WVK15170.1 serine hydrolase domain-containing protein [Flavivirga sp. MEBiC07777]
MKKNILHLVASLLFLIACKTGVEKSFNKNENVVHAIEKAINEKELPGLNYSIIDVDGNIDNYSVGYSDVEQKENLNINHTLFSGSIGKTYAVALLMNLVESKKVNLKDKLITYFPDTEWLSKLPNINDITIEMLLQHTSGLPRYVFKSELWKALHDNPNKVWTYKERLSYILNDEPVHEAGKQWSYSDTNYILLGMLIEKVTSKNYYDLVQDEFLKPNNLKNTYPSLTRNIPNLAIGYSNMGDTFYVPNKTVENGQYFMNPQVEWTGGGMASTTSDLARWAKLYYESKLFSQESLRLITTPNPNGVDVEHKSSYGMGSFIYTSKLGEAFGHSGFMPGFNSLFIYYPEKKIAAAIQFNCDYASATLNMNDLIDDLVLISITE